MSSSFGELVGLCHFRPSKVTSAISSSGGKGGNGTLHEVNRSTTSLNSLGRAERDRMGGNGRKRQETEWGTNVHTQMATVNGRNSDIKKDNREGESKKRSSLWECLPYTQVIFGSKAEWVSWSWWKLGHSVLFLGAVVALLINPSALPLQWAK